MSPFKLVMVNVNTHSPISMSSRQSNISAHLRSLNPIINRFLSPVWSHLGGNSLGVITMFPACC